jgi:hypothetical protein
MQDLSCRRLVFAVGEKAGATSQVAMPDGSRAFSRYTAGHRCCLRQLGQ